MKVLVTVTTLFALATFIVNVLLLVKVGMYGNRLKKLRVDEDTPSKEILETFRLHKKYITWFVVTLLVMVVFIEIPKLIMGEHGSDQVVLFAYHIRFVVASVILIVFMFIFNGERFPWWHSLIAVVMFHAYGFMALTGLPLMYEALMKYYS